MKLFFEKILIIFLIFLIFIILLEIILRFTVSSNKYTPSLYPIDLFDYNSPTSLKKNYYGKTAKSETQTDIKINSIGCRDEEKNINNKKLNILGLGGSLVFGHGVDYEKTFLRITEKSLENKFSIHKCGVPGWRLGEIKNYYEKYYINDKPDIVLLNFFIGNGFNFQPKENDPPNEITLSKNVVLFLKIKSFFREYSFSYRFIVDRIKTNRFITKILFKSNIANGFINIKQIELFTNIFYEKNKKNMDNLFNDFIYLNENSKNLIVTILPSKFQIDNNFLKNSIKQTNLTENNINKYLPNNILINFFNKHDISYLDLTNKFEEKYINNKSLFFQIDEHYSVDGHKILSRNLINFIKENEKNF